MFEKLTGIKGGLSAVLGTMFALFGMRGVLFLAFLVLMSIDYATGWIAAVKNGEWQSSKAREGIAHKLGMIVVIVISGIMDLCLQVICGLVPDIPFLWPSILFPLCLTWYIITELGSIVENAALLGAPIPSWLMRALEISKKIVDNVADKNVDNEEN